MLYGELPQVTTPSGETLNGVTVRYSNPPKSAVLRLPSNQEMIERLSLHKSIRRTIGRRKSQMESIPNLKADLDLFNLIRLDKGGVEFDEYEASDSIGKITYNEVTDYTTEEGGAFVTHSGCERVGDQYRITLKTPFGTTTHTMNIPSRRDITFYRRSVISSIDLPHGQEEVRYRIEPAVTLYNAAVSAFDGYASSYKPEDIPPHHKSSVIIELVQAIDELDSILDPNS